MKILLEHAEAELNIKNSRFLAEVFPVASQAEAREKLHQLKQLYADATHVVHAFVVGKNAEVCGMSDDGEPGGTAGRPVLDVLKGSGITNIILSVTRWFGGTLLGTGGLVHAYGDSAKAVLAVCKSEELIEKTPFTFSIDYSIYDSVKHFFPEYHISKVEEKFESEVSISGEIWTTEIADFALRLKNLTRGAVDIY